MKSVFFPKTMLWQVFFTVLVLGALVGLLQLNASVTNMQSQSIRNQSAAVSNEGQESTSSAGNHEQSGQDVQVQKEQTGELASQNQFFIEYRMQRDRARGQQTDLLREIVNNGNSTEEVRKEAQKRLLQISQLLEKEMEIENMIRAKDIKDAVVFLQEKNATVIVQAQKLSAQEEETIKTIVQRVAGTKDTETVVIPKP